VPASLHFQRPNRHLDLVGSPFYLLDRTRPWVVEAGPRIAGVSGFGFGGTNCHVILQEADPPVARQLPGAARPQLLAVSASSSAALEQVTDTLAESLAKVGDQTLADLCFTRTCRRPALRQRLAVVGRDAEELLAGLRSAALQPVARIGERPRIGLLLTGQGAQYPGMGAALRRRDSSFARDLDRCVAAFAGVLDGGLERLLSASSAEQLTPTSLTQPLIFTIDYCLARLWLRLGVEPVALIGHSIGELAAACVAGVFELDDAARFVAARGRAMEQAPGRGAMAAVLAGPERVEALLGGGLEIAARNGPTNTVVSGTPEAIAALGERARHEGLRVIPLEVSHAFHSRLMEPVLAPLEAQLGHVALRRPEIPIISTLTGDFVDEELTRPGYWSRQLRSCVAFAPALERLAARGVDVVIEAGPSDTLTKLAEATLQERALALASMRRADEECETLLDSVARLWAGGLELDLDELFGQARLVDLPPYPFADERHRLELGPAPERAPTSASSVGVGATSTQIILAQLRARDISLADALARLSQKANTL
jgi:acyl transferase domain-containing protein